MQLRPLGKTGLQVSEIGFGAWQLGNRTDWDAMDDRTAFDLVDEALGAGITLFDTAPNYSAGRSERLLGQALEGRRKDVVLVSKFGRPPEGPVDFSADRFRPRLEASLERLRTDYLDVLLLHNPDPAVYEGADPIWDALEAARRDGLVRHYGASLDLAHEIEAILTNTGSTVLEILFNILHQDVRRAFPRVGERGAGPIVKVPLDSGWLSGRYDASSRFEGVRGRWTPADIARRAELISQLDWLTDDGSGLTEKAMAYVLSYDEVSCVIPGIRSREHLRRDLGTAGRRLSPAERARLEAFWDEFTENGSRLLPW